MFALAPVVDSGNPNIQFSTPGGDRSAACVESRLASQRETLIL
jgi:hypothetical protein